ncbi:MAG: Putative hydrolase [Acetothermia bacterium 64_32]|nr:MAG: Putative hydrolase [Acetothermia bacterium 64_32]
MAIVFQGLLFENRPLTGFSAYVMTRMYRFLEAGYRTYIVTRKPGLPEGYSMQDMANDYAEMIKEEFGGPVDVIGVSTGGSIAQHFAADHPQLVRRLVLHSSAFTLREEAKRAQMRVGQLARERRWRAAYAALMDLSFPRKGIWKYLIRPFLWLGSLFGGVFFGVPEDPADLVITIEAEDKHDFKERLAQIKAPTLVVGGDKDPFYTEALFHKTAEGIPNAKLIVYKGMGHPASGKQFGQDVIKFLNEKPAEHACVKAGLR